MTQWNRFAHEVLFRLGLAVAIASPACARDELVDSEEALASVRDLPRRSPDVPAGIDAPGYRVDYLVRPNPLAITSGLAANRRGHLYIGQIFNNRLTRLELETGRITELAGDDETGPDALNGPDELVIGPDGDLYVTEFLGQKVTRVSPNGRRRKVLAAGVSDGFNSTDGIAFNARGELFASDLSFDPEHPGGLWRIDPEGRLPPVEVLRPLPGPEGFAFGPDGLAYVPELWGGRVDVIDVARGQVVHTLAEGFEMPSALKVDPAGDVILVETGTGSLWRIDRATGNRSLIAKGERGLDCLEIAPSGAMYVSSFLRGGIYRVDVKRRALEPIVPRGDLSIPSGLAESSDGTLWVGNTVSVSSVSRSGQVTEVSSGFVDVLDSGEHQLLTFGVVVVGDAVYYTDFVPFVDSRISRLDLTTGARSVAARGFFLPMGLTEGPDGKLLVYDQAFDQASGAVLLVDPSSGERAPLVSGLMTPSGLAYDDRHQIVYVSEAATGRVLAVPLSASVPFPVAEGLTTPEGLALDGDGGLFVLEGDLGALVRVDLESGDVSPVATGLPTRLRGPRIPPTAPLFNIPASVLVRQNGDLIISGDANGSLVRLRRRGRGP